MNKFSLGSRISMGFLTILLDVDFAEASGGFFAEVPRSVADLRLGDVVTFRDSCGEIKEARIERVFLMRIS